MTEHPKATEKETLLLRNRFLPEQQATLKSPPQVQARKVTEAIWVDMECPNCATNYSVYGMVGEVKCLTCDDCGQKFIRTIRAPEVKVRITTERR